MTMSAIEKEGEREREREREAVAMAAETTKMELFAVK